MPPVPDTIGPYRVLRLIAAGGTAEVYEVRHSLSGECLALKLLVPPSSPMLAQETMLRFNREYSSMNRLNHPSIVRVYEYGTHDARPWFTMEMLRGQPAQAAAKRAGRPGSEDRTAEVIRIGYHVAQALRCIHERGLVHRDLKSANVLVLPDERVKLLDFGAAFHINGPFERLTAQGEFIGTFAYASPEQIAGRSIDARSDIYSLGVLLFRLATGKRLFESDDEKELARMHLSQPAADPRSLVAELPGDLCALILEMLSKRPSERPASAEALLSRLEAVHGGPFVAPRRLVLHDQGIATRDLAMRQARDELEQPFSSLITVEGDEGSDRLRFIEAIYASVTARGWLAALVPFSRGASLPRLIDALGSISVGCNTAEATAALSEIVLGTSQTGLTQPALRSAARAAAVRLIRLATMQRPVVLLVQEVHRADPPTNELLTALRRAFPDEEVVFKLVVGGNAAAFDTGSELAHRLGDGLRISLEPLSGRLLAVAVGDLLSYRPPPSHIVRRLFEQTGGQPLFLEEAVADLVDLGGLVLDGARPMWTEQAITIPPPERSLTAAQRCFDEMPHLSRRMLEALWVAADTATPAILAQILGWSLPELRILLDRLVRTGILWWCEGARPEWRVPLLANIVSAGLSPCRRAALSRGLASLSAQLPPSNAMVRALASSGRALDAIRTALVIGRRMIERSELRSVLTLLSELIPANLLDPTVPAKTSGSFDLRVGLPPTVERSAEFAELLLLYAHCCTRTQPHDPSGGRALARAKSIIDPRGERVAITRVILEGARQLEVSGQHEAYRKELKRALSAQSGQVPSLALQITTEIVRSYRVSGDFPKAETFRESAAALHTSSKEDPIAVALSEIEASECLFAAGKLVEAELLIVSVLQRFERTAELGPFWLALARWAKILCQQGRFSEALTQLAIHSREASQSEDHVPYVELVMAMARVELELSRLGRAQEYYDELYTLVRKVDSFQTHLEMQILQGRILLISGEFRLAGIVLLNVFHAARDAGLFVIAELSRAFYAEALHASGEREKAQALFHAANLGLMATGDLPALALGCRARARCCAAEIDPDEIFRPAQRLFDDPPSLPLRIEYLLALVAWHGAQGDRDRTTRYLDEARILLDKLAKGLNDTDRAALDAHPWSERVRQGVQQ